jgi:hypothetical protein
VRPSRGAGPELGLASLLGEALGLVVAEELAVPAAGKQGVSRVGRMGGSISGGGG